MMNGIKAHSLIECKMDNIVFVDIQGFKDGKTFILKELCFVRGESVQHFIFKPPFKYNNLSIESKREAIYLTTLVHGFYWNEGKLDYSQIDKCFESLLLQQQVENNLIIYVKGMEKIRWLKELCKSSSKLVCYNIEDIGCQKKKTTLFDFVKPHCDSHARVGQCAYQNVMLLQEWYEKKHK